jgi:hypothetical protein
LASECTALIASASLQVHRHIAGRQNHPVDRALVSAYSRQRKQMGSRRHVGVAYERRTSLDRFHEGSSALAVARGVGQCFT